MRLPNHVRNILRLEGDEQKINQLMEAVKNDEYGIGTIDFEKVIPMPSNIYRGSLGRAEQEKYGKDNWYDWSVANWGTKWNAYGYYEGGEYAPKEGETPTITLNTAWCAPHPVIDKLAGMYPDVDITHEWADEDIGRNCGRYEYKDGERTEEYYPEGKEAYDFSFRMWDISPEDCYLTLNDRGDAYISLYSDEYELVEVEGQKALFANERLTRSDIPKGMYCYDIRSGDNGEMCSLEKRVAVDHAGTIVTKEPINLGKLECIEFTEETAPNFLGEKMNFKDFIDYDLEQEETMGMEMSE